MGRRRLAQVETPVSKLLPPEPSCVTTLISLSPCLGPAREGEGWPGPSAGHHSWVTSSAPNSPPYRRGHSSPQEQSFSVWPCTAQPLLLPVWVGRTKPLLPGQKGREGSGGGWWGEMARPGASWGHRGTQAGAERQDAALAKAFALGWADSGSDHGVGALGRVCSKVSLLQGTQQREWPWTT